MYLLHFFPLPRTSFAESTAPLLCLLHSDGNEMLTTLTKKKEAIFRFFYLTFRLLACLGVYCNDDHVDFF
jgi:hypothetical protein